NRASTPALGSTGAPLCHRTSSFSTCVSPFVWLLLIRLIRANAVCSVLGQLFGAATATRARRAETLGAGRRTRQSEKCRGGAEVRGSSWSCRHTADKPPEVCIFRIRYRPPFKVLSRSA